MSDSGLHRRFVLVSEERGRWVGTRGRSPLADSARNLEES
jgi:hypothetical protein